LNKTDLITDLSFENKDLYKFEKLIDFPFESSRKRMGIIVKD